jgi:hypothetical protein
MRRRQFITLLGSALCIDRLHELGANEQLKVLTERLQKLAVRAIAEDGHKRSQLAQRHDGR